MAANPPITERGNISGEPNPGSWSSWFPGDDLERVVELQWPTSIVAYASMMNDAQIYSLYQGFMWPIRAYDWYIDPNGAKPEIVDRISTDYNLPVGSRRDGRVWNRRRGARRFSFDKHLEDALRGPQYGHYPFEQVGEVLDDGKWHLRKLSPRPPKTISEIHVADDGSLKWYRQLGMDIREPPIGIDRTVWYAWDREGANWTGRSMLRSVYRNHLVKDRVLRVGAINIERAGGVPYAQAPEGASAAQIKELDALARRFRVGEAAGAALPHGAQLKFAAAAGGDGAVAFIKQQNEEMARAFLQMVNMLGQTNSGSRALGGTFLDIAQIAQWTIAKWFADLFNEHVIEDDVEWNEGPEEEYAPLLAFDAGGSHPLEAFQEADGEDTGLQINDPQTRAMLDLDPVPARSRRRNTARRQSGGHEAQAGGTVQAQAASPLLLPSRPLRRQPNEQEIQAAVNFMELDSAFDSALQLLLQEVRLLQSYQIDSLHDAIVQAGGDMSKLANLSVAPESSAIILTRLMGVASLGAEQAIQEARNQGVDIPRQDVADVESVLKSRAEAVAQIISSQLSQSASRESVRLTGGALSPIEVADAVREHLRNLTGTYEKDMLGGAIQASVNAGRRLVFTRDAEPGEIHASELLDTNTCSPCIAIDGRQYASMEEADRDYPTGHFKDCQGRERCRGMLIKVYSKVREPEATA